MSNMFQQWQSDALPNMARTGGTQPAMRAISEDRFWEHFQPIEVRDGETLWEYEEVIAAAVPVERVWTVIEGDNGRDLYAAPGFHIVNRLGYCVTKEPWEDITRDARF